MWRRRLLNKNIVKRTPAGVVVEMEPDKKLEFLERRAKQCIQESDRQKTLALEYLRQAKNLSRELYDYV
jgi:hypothetical protein